MKNLEFIRWQPEYSVGCKSIDVQHQQVIAVLNKLYESLRKNDPLDTLKPTLLKLRLFTETHFQYEETVMKALRHDGYQDQVKMHTRMKHETISIIERIITSGTGGHSLLHFLKDWWVRHIQEVDMKYKDLVRKLDI